MPQRSRTLVFCTSILHSLVSAQLNVPSPQVLLQGRFGGAQGAQSSYAATPLLFSWPASAVFATFVGDSVTATLTAQAPTVTSNAYCRFAFNIDERQADIKSVTINKRTIQWSATGLSPGKHNLVIIKLTEASYCQVNLEALSAPGGMFLPPELPSAFQSGRRIMFIGDSYTVGYANTGGTNSCSMTACNPVTKSCGPELDSQNAAIAWGPLTAANFHADYQVIAWSGSGLVACARSQLMLRDSPEVPRSVACSIYPTAVDLFGRQVAADSSSVVSNYSSWVPQVVVLAGGTNDFIPGFQPLPIDEWRSQVLEFIDTINSRYGNPDIIIQVFPSKLLEQGVLLEDEAATYLRYMTSLYNQTQSEGRKNIYLLKLNADDMPFDNWCASHPSAAADANIAAQLSSFINARLPNWTVST